MPETLDPRFYDLEAHSYDALLVVSFGGPEGPEDVMPFLDNVFRGLRVTDETKARIAARYQRFGGVSPINAHTREFIAALQKLLDAEGPALPIYWGNRNWHPLVGDTLKQTTASSAQRPTSRARSARIAAAESIERISSRLSRGWQPRRSSTSCASASIIRASSPPSPIA
jgi:protoheme ferro-lyase